MVTPLFELWDQFLSSQLSRQLINNLRFNDEQWNHSVAKIQLKRRHSLNVFTAKTLDKPMKRCSSLSDVNQVKVQISLSEWLKTYRPEPTKCINGCGTPPNAEEAYYRYTNRSKVLWDLQMDEEDEDEDQEEHHFGKAAPHLKPYTLQMQAHLAQAQQPSYSYDKVRLILII